MGATEALGTALYSSGHFERALVEFHKVNRRRQNIYDDWITRCEETIKAFLAAANVEIETVEGGHQGSRAPGHHFGNIFTWPSLALTTKYK